MEEGEEAGEEDEADKRLRRAALRSGGVERVGDVPGDDVDAGGDESRERTREIALLDASLGESAMDSQNSGNRRLDRRATTRWYLKPLLVPTGRMLVAVAGKGHHGRQWRRPRIIVVAFPTVSVVWGLICWFSVHSLRTKMGYCSSPSHRGTFLLR